ncbi:MAG: hypothetical protein MZV70_37405 [Desulfobacterales bacterium]|nr:hypothetical protein [Desulfobacterales bacterium]
MFGFGCFSVNQVYAWQLRFDRNNFTHWLKRGYLVRLRQGLYAFPEYRDTPGRSAVFRGSNLQPVLHQPSRRPFLLWVDPRRYRADHQRHVFEDGPLLERVRGILVPERAG